MGDARRGDARVADQMTGDGPVDVMLVRWHGW
jgi:hypothetical protein